MIMKKLQDRTLDAKVSANADAAPMLNCWRKLLLQCTKEPEENCNIVPRRPHDQPDVWIYWWFCWLHWHDDVGLCYHRTSDAADCTDIDTDILTLVLVQRVILELKMIPILILILTFIVLKCWSWSVWTRIIRKFFVPLLQDEVTVGSMAVRHWVSHGMS